ncbi:hypothetical protein BOX15_Mlig032845g1, partial [Macrostomum lignano]
ALRMDARKQELLEARFQGPSYGGASAASTTAAGDRAGGLSQSSSGQSGQLDAASNPSTADFSASFNRESVGGNISGTAVGNSTVITMVTISDTTGTEEPPQPGQASAALAAAAAAVAAAGPVASSSASPSACRSSASTAPAAAGSKAARKRRAGPAGSAVDDAAAPSSQQQQAQPKTPGSSGGRCRRIDEFYTKFNPAQRPPSQPVAQPTQPAVPPSSLPLLPAPAALSNPPCVILSDDSCSSRSSDGAAVSSATTRRPGRPRKRQQQQQQPLQLLEAAKSRLSPVKECQASPDARTELADVIKARDDLARMVASQRNAIQSLKDSQERGREMLRSLLIEKSRAEKRESRNRCQANRLRLGQFHSMRRGTELEEKWFDGFAFLELHRRRHFIEQEKERIEKERKQWNKRKPALAGGATKTVGSRKLLAASPGTGTTGASDLDADEFFTQLEVYDIQRQVFIKDEKEIRDEMEKLDRERNVHIREMKRIQNEDSSRFQGNTELHDRYMLLSLLGRGGFSEVHKAYDLSEHRFVACKIHQLNPAWPKEKKDNYIRHAVREIEIHKTLHHPRIVEVYDVFDIDCDCFCTVLEYSKGCDLDFYLKQNKSLPEREARNIICQVVSALKYLNQRKPPVIHYDLKPGNILLGEGDSIAAIKLTDFGLSKVMTEDKFQADTGMDLTSPGSGTYWYLPPECFETGSENVPKISSKVDVWSVGVIFYQCLYGQKPFGNNLSQADVLRNHTILLHARRVEFPPSTPSSCRVSEQAKNFIRRCVTHDKRLRPDVLQLAEDEYLKSKAQLKFDTSTAALSPAAPQPLQ